MPPASRGPGEQRAILVGRGAIAIAVLALALILGAYLARGEVVLALLRRTAARTIFHDTVAELPDGLHVGLCGTGSPFPDPTRAGPCTAVVAGPRVFVVDAGRGSADVVARMGLQGRRIGGLVTRNLLR